MFLSFSTEKFWADNLFTHWQFCHLEFWLLKNNEKMKAEMYAKYLLNVSSSSLLSIATKLGGLNLELTFLQDYIRIDISPQSQTFYV